MKKILFVTLCLMGALTVTETQGQTLPKYAYYKFFNEYGVPDKVAFHYSGFSRIQAIYRPYQLPGLPAGPISSVYFKVGGFVDTTGPGVPPPPTPITITFDSVWVKMGLLPFQDSTYSDTMISGKQYILFKTGLSLVSFQRNYQVIGADSAGTWFRFPVSAGFSYNPNMNLVVELDRGFQNYDGGIDLMTNHYGYQDWRYPYIIYNFNHTDPVAYNPYLGQMDIGFDDAPTTVGGLVNLKGFYAFPNPSQGLFTVGFEP
ncbi:MAG: hypothetical protein JST27_09585, partial [Bacteroidetes bacterium]|nr:hypothetical protein [Bacteroidota bacterium]